MPCQGPSDAECRDIEAYSNFKKHGKLWDDQQFAINVACAFGKHVTDGVPIPSWAASWWNEHQKEDALKKQEYAIQKHNKEVIRLKLLARKLGKKVV